MRYLGSKLCLFVVLGTIVAACTPAAPPPPTSAPQPPATTAAPQAKAVPASTAAPVAKAAPSAEPAKPAALAMKKLRVLLSFQNGISFFPVPIAERLGYFRDEGIEMDLQVVNGSSALIQQLAGGNADIGISLAPNALLGTAEGVKIKSFYDWMSKNAFDVWVRSDSPLTKLADLKGRTVGVSDVTRGGAPILRASLAKAGLDPQHDVSLVAVGTARPGQIQALKDKRVDASQVSLSALAYWQTVLGSEGIELKCLSCDSQELRLASETWVARTELIERDRAYVVGFGRALAKGSLFTQTNFDAALAILKEVQPQEHTDATIASKLLTDMLSSKGSPREGGKYGFADVGSWERLQEFMLAPSAAEATGLQSRVDIQQLVTNDLIGEINQFDAEAVKKQAREWKP
jgi:NitT/TauT family transport system substrate-binding protein